MNRKKRNEPKTAKRREVAAVLALLIKGDGVAQGQDTRAVLLAHAERLKTAVGVLEQVAMHADDLNIEVSGLNMYVLSGPRLAVEPLIQEGLLWPQSWPGVGEGTSK